MATRREALTMRLRDQVDKTTKGPLPRKYYYCAKLDESYDKKTGPNQPPLDPRPGPQGSNLISSKLWDGRHAPAIDLDMEAQVVPSSTPGHCHLYIEKAMSDVEYFKLLDVMVEVGLVESGYVDAAKQQGMTTLRPSNQFKHGSAYAETKKQVELLQATIELKDSAIQKLNDSLEAAEQRALEAEEKASMSAMETTWS